VGSAWIQSTCGRCEWCQRGHTMFCPYLKGTGADAQGGSRRVHADERGC
jgi:D-arabinose 1-dehydrogenase-like Zn-dependent alcohol dehydrogenase